MTSHSIARLFWLTAVLAYLGGPVAMVQGAEQTPAKDSARGQRLFNAYCARCHGVKGLGGAGANLRHGQLRHATDAKRLFAVIQAGIPGTAMPGNWFLADRDIQHVAEYVRSIGDAPAETPPGDPVEGQRIYEKAECAKCHIVDGRGFGVGPNLSDIGARRGLDFMRQAIVHPGKEMAVDAKGYAAYLVIVVVTRDGRVMTGTRINEDTFTIQIRDQKNQIHSFRKRDLDGLKKTDGSLMPSFDEKLSPRDIDHLISYLAGLRGTP